MFNLNKAIAAFAVVPMAATLIAVGLIASPAAADPPPPTGASYCGVGSDTTQDVTQKLASTLNSGLATPTPANRKFESWNATGSTPITTTCAAGSFTRPNGSSAGINALRDSLGLDAGPIASNAITFARSSRGPNDTTTTDLTWIPFGVDAVAPAVKSGGAIDTFYAGALTIAQLQSIYTCATTSITVGGLAWTIKPYVPQAGSGTRSFWLTAVGITEAQVNTTCVKDTNVVSGLAMQEHDGTVLTDPTVAGVRYAEIIPISIAQNIAQTNSALTGVVDRRGSSKLLSLGGQAPIVSGKINASWPAAYKRSVYNVFRTTKVTGGVADAHLVALFVGNSSKVCSATATINLFGFLTDATCGATTLKGKK